MLENEVVRRQGRHHGLHVRAIVHAVVEVLEPHALVGEVDLLHTAAGGKG